MFCPYCAAETTQGLNYCNRCGGSLAPLTAPQETRVNVAPGAAWAAGLTTMVVIVVGLGMLFPITSELLLRGVDPTVVVVIALTVALADIVCVAMLLRFWSSLFGVGPARRGSKDAPAALPAHKSQDTRGLDAPRFDSLNPAPVPSITEQTTRTLEREAVNRKP